MTGVLVPHSGKGVFQRTLFCSFQNSGRPLSWLVLSPRGPRQAGQFSAASGEVDASNNTLAKVSSG